MARTKEEDDELPWNEEKWERFLQESEARSARYSDLFETLLDHPDRDEIIEHEMGWDKPVERDDLDPDDEPFDAEAVIQEALDSVDDGEWEEERAREEAELEAQPAYSRGFAFGLTVHHALKGYMEANELEPGDDLVQAYTNSMVIAAKLAGAHGMGYEDEVLCGNICTCNRSLTAANECLTALGNLRRDGMVPAEVLDPLIAECKAIRGLVEEHIAELRSRVWWE